MIHWKSLLATVVAAMLLVSCGTTSPADPGETDTDGDTIEAATLEGVWEVTYEGGVTIDEIQTLRFGEEVHGTASSVSMDPANGTKRCTTEPYALLSDGGLQLDGFRYAVEERDATTIRLGVDGSDVAIVLTNVTDDPPVEPCIALETDGLNRARGHYLHPSSVLSGYGQRLYYTLDLPSSPIVAYDAAGEATAATYDGYGEPFVVAAPDAADVYAYCRCGAGNTLARIDIATGTLEAESTVLENETDFRVEYGYFADGDLVVGGRDVDNDRDLLLTLDASTLDVLSQRVILPGTGVTDVAYADGQVLALSGSAIHVLDDAGMAVETYSLQGANGILRGIAVSGRLLYVLTEVGGEARILEAVLP